MAEPHNEYVLNNRRFKVLRHHTEFYVPMDHPRRRYLVVQDVDTMEVSYPTPDDLRGAVEVP